MKTIDDLYNNLSKEIRLITQTEMLFTERNNLALLIENLDKARDKEVLRIRNKIKLIDKDINKNCELLNIYG